ncbi:MAG: YihY/virulence factor BrkB family protein [Lachnospira sp.]
MINKTYTIITTISKKISKDRITDYASQSCYYLILSFFPLMLLLMSLVKFLPVTEQDLLDFILGIIPGQLDNMVTGIMEDLYSNSSIAVTSVSAIGLLWASGKGFMVIMRCLDNIYECPNKKNWLIKRIFATLYSMIFAVSVIINLLFMVFGSNITNVIKKILPGSTTLVNIIISIINNKIFLFPALFTLYFAIIYTLVPSRKTNFFREIPGALISSIGWYIFSSLLSLYISHSPKFSYMYGSLTTFIFSLIWIYACMITIFVGAEINYIINDLDFPDEPLDARNDIRNRLKKSNLK